MNNNRTSKLIERDRRFCNEVYDYNTRPYESSTQYRLLESTSKLRFMGIVSFIVSIVWLLFNAFINRKYNLKNPVFFSSILVVGVISIIVSTFSFIWHKNKYTGIWIRILMMIYYLSLLYEITGQIIAQNQYVHAYNTERGLETLFMGIEVSTLLFLLPVLTPLVYRRDSIVYGCFVIGTTFIPWIVKGGEVYNINQQVVVRVALIALYTAISLIMINNSRVVLKQAEIEEKLRFTSIIDNLTGLLNRTAYFDYLKKVNQKSNTTIGTIILDIDFFKQYNDNYNHLEGDKILKNIANALIKVAEKEGLYAFRFGGEEFVTIKMGANEEELLKIAEEINYEVWMENNARTDIVSFDRITITAGCGISESGDGDKTPSIDEADGQLYMGKENGRNCVVFKNRKYVLIPSLIDSDISVLNKYSCEKLIDYEQFNNSLSEENEVIDKKTVLIVDDAELNHDMLSDMLSDTFNIMHAYNGLEAVRILEADADSVDIMLLDIVMPEMDGIATLSVMNEKHWIEKIPVLVVSAEYNAYIERQCLEEGATDFIHKPFIDIVVKTRMLNAIEQYSYRNELEKKVIEQTQDLAFNNQRLNLVNENTITLLAKVVEARDVASGEHINRVKDYTRILAMALRNKYPKYKITKEQVNIISKASVLHDIGKIFTPDSILLKPGKLTQEEFNIMKEHTFKGCKLIEDATELQDQSYIKAGREICHYHHERFDGKGYPCGLVGNEIPISAQIVSIADCYDALVSNRCYRKGLPREKAFDMIISGECGIFNPDLIVCFISSRELFEEVLDKYESGNK